MTETLDQEFRQQFEEFAKKHLPGQLGEELRKQLNELVSLRQINKQLNESLVKLQDNIRKHLEEKQELKSKLINQEEIDKRLVEVEKRERDMELHDLKLQLANEKQSNDKVFNLVSQLTKNPIFRETVFEHNTIESRWIQGKEELVTVGKNSNKTTDTE